MPTNRELADQYVEYALGIEKQLQETQANTVEGSVQYQNGILKATLSAVLATHYELRHGNDERTQLLYALNRLLRLWDH